MPVLQPTHNVHGIAFERTGACNRCGVCCVDEDCSHYAVVDELPTCLIYNQRHNDCGEHDYSHAMCITFPDHPWLKVIKKQECSYQFARLDKDGNVSNEPLLFADIDK